MSRRIALLTFALVAWSIADAAPALADERTFWVNTLTAEQALDVATTYTDIREQRAYELDPLARPFVHSLPELIAATAGANLLLRRLPLPFLKAYVSIYPVVLGNNIVIMLRPHWGKCTAPQGCTYPE